MTLKPRVSYLLPGALDWVIDSGETPYLIVYARHTDAVVPIEYVQEDGTIVLNISGTAIRNLHFDAAELSFDSRFSGVSQFIRIPYEAVLGMIGKESGQGIYFPRTTLVQVSLSSLKQLTKPRRYRKRRRAKREASGPTT